MRSILISVVMALAVTACTYPVTRVEQSTEKPSLTVAGLAKDSEAVITVDNISYGRAVLYNGRDYKLSLESGVHVVEIHDGERLLFSEKVFLANGMTKAVTVQ